MQENLIGKLEVALKNAPADRHSYFQLHHFVIEKETTIPGKIWQCLRELRSRKTQLEAIEREICESQDRIELLDIETEEEGIHLERYLKGSNDATLKSIAEKKYAVNKRRKERQKEAAVDGLKQLFSKKQAIIEETEFLLNAYENLCKIEQPKSLDDTEAQVEYWNEKLSQEVHLRLLLRQNLDIELVKTVLGLNSNSPIKKELLNLLQQLQQPIEHSKKEALCQTD